MQLPQKSEQYKGTVFVLGAYILWGILPIYWKILQHVPAQEVLAHRIVWCLVFLLLIIIGSRRWSGFVAELAAILRQPKKALGIVVASVLLNLNWFTYIWAVQQDRIIETSLGYYINPLVSVLLGMLILKERLSLWQYVAFFLALLGVLNMTVNFGAVPWVALLLAITFGLYGLLKKMINVGAITGLTIETAIMAIWALIFLAVTHQGGQGSFDSGFLTAILLIGAGVVTGVPLLLFNAGALRLPLKMVGFLQYLSPTINLLIGVYLYHESFTRVHLFSFILIWIGLVVFSLAGTPLFLRLEDRILRKRQRSSAS